MKLTQRQLGKISGIISEEATMRNNLHESMYENRKQSRINEVFLSEPELPFDAVPDYLRMRIEDDYSQTNPLFSEIVTKFNKVVYSALSDLMKQAGKDDKNAIEWESELSELGSDDAEKELYTDLLVAMTSYAQNVGQIAIDSLEAEESLKDETSFQPDHE